MEGLPIAGCTIGLTSVLGKFSAMVSSTFSAISVSVALLPDAPLATQGTRTTTMSSQTRSFQGLNARGRGR